jgi:glycosyltransferase involved in cell wall biosynthesis
MLQRVPDGAGPDPAVELRVAPWPDDRGNPYQRLFYDALAPHGVRKVEGLSINDGALRRLASNVDVVHLHWPEYAWRVGGRRFHHQVRLAVGLFRFLQLAKELGLRVWWTAHNIEPHEGSRLFNWFAYRLVARQSHLVIAHSHRAARQVRRRFGNDRVVVMPHGNFRGVYPPPRAREIVLSELGLNPAIPMVSCLGAIRPYKGFTLAVDAVSRLGGRVQLVIAGDPKTETDAAELEALRANRPWLRLMLRRTSDQEFSDVLSASDALLLPYRRATTSGVLLTAWSAGRGVIASNISYFADELIEHPNAGVLATPGDPGAFADAIESYLSLPAAERQRAAFAAAAAHEWTQCVGPVVSVLRTEVAGRRR